MNINRIVFVITFGFFSVYSGTPVLQWDYKSGGPDHDSFESVLVSENKEIVAVGFEKFTSYPEYNKYKAKTRVCCLDSDGNFSWEKIFGDSTECMDGHSIAEVDDGYLIAGSRKRIVDSKIDYKASLFLIRLDREGEMIWRREYDPDVYNIYCKQILQLADNDILITTTNHPIQGDDGYCYSWTLKVDASGDTVWTKKTHFEERVNIASFLQTGESELLGVGSWSEFVDHTSGLFILRLNAFGDSLGISKYDPQDDYFYVKDVRVDDSYVFYVLTSEELIKINRNAEIISRRPAFNFCSVGILDDDNYLLAGNSGIIKYDGSDNEIWSFHYTTDDGLFIYSMALNGLSEFVLCGTSSVNLSNSQGVIYKVIETEGVQVQSRTTFFTSRPTMKQKTFNLLGQKVNTGISNGLYLNSGSENVLKQIHFRTGSYHLQLKIGSPYVEK